MATGTSQQKTRKKIKMYDKVRAVIRCQLMSPDNVNIYVLITRNEMISIL